MLAPAQVTRDSLVKAGEQLVWIGLKLEQVPATALVLGQKVRLCSRVPGSGHGRHGQESGVGQIRRASPAGW
ncbi:hypothetical protein LV779_18375 [Streptomyces thinghirensis]|nr:hypothetical protein [Streptomyces thinghirensis]